MDEIGIAEKVVEIAQGLLIGTDEKDRKVILLAARAVRAPAAPGQLSSNGSMKRLILPSESQVMSTRVARRSGSSSRR